jgi:predicted RNA-binding Zn-ribbon protein involved in translation (DUF1610 family)
MNIDMKKPQFTVTDRVRVIPVDSPDSEHFTGVVEGVWWNQRLSRLEYAVKDEEGFRSDGWLEHELSPVTVAAIGDSPCGEVELSEFTGHNHWHCPVCGSDEMWFDRTVNLGIDGTEEGMKNRCTDCGRDVDEDDPVIPGGWKIGMNCHFTYFPNGIATREIGTVWAYNEALNTICIKCGDELHWQKHTSGFGGISGVAENPSTTGSTEV